MTLITEKIRIIRNRFEIIYSTFQLSVDSATKIALKPPTNGMTPIYLEPKPEPYLVHHLEGSHSCPSNPSNDNPTHSSTVGGSLSLNLPLNAASKNEGGSMKVEEAATSTVVKNDDLSSTSRSSNTAGTNISNQHELTNMQPAPPSSYNPYSPIQYNGVGV